MISLDAHVFGGGLIGPPVTSDPFSTTDVNDVLVAMGWVDGAPGVSPTFSDLAGLVWTMKYVDVDPGAGCFHLWVAYAIPNQILTNDTVTWAPGGGVLASVAVIALGGVDKTTIFDPDASLPALGGGAGGAATATYSTSNAYDILIGVGESCNSGGPIWSSFFGLDGIPYEADAVQVVASVQAGVSETYSSNDGTGIMVFAVMGIGAPPPPVNVTITTSPVFVNSITVDGTTYNAPQTFNWLGGTLHSIEALGVPAYTFVSWSDAGGQAHVIVAAVSTTITAAYVVTPIPPGPCLVCLNLDGTLRWKDTTASAAGKTQAAIAIHGGRIYELAHDALGILYAFS